MLESIITLSLVGLLVGITFSMPIAGPISIIVTTNALKGNVRYCMMVSSGGSVVIFLYTFFAAFGLTKLYPYYKPSIPYLIAFGSVFLLFLGIRIIRTKFDIEHAGDKSRIAEKSKKLSKNDFYTGLLINFLNPTLFLGWLTSTFWVISIVSTMGMNTGGLDLTINQSIKDLEKIKSNLYTDSLSMETDDPMTVDTAETIVESEDQHSKRGTHLILSLFYAFFVAVGSVLWFYLLSMMISKFRNVINTRLLAASIKGLGVILCIFSIYLGVIGVRLFIPKFHLNAFF
jgi:threonine/homoserine/homoserine lactone efflux protein